LLCVCSAPRVVSLTSRFLLCSEPASPGIVALSLHDALPIFLQRLCQEFVIIDERIQIPENRSVGQTDQQHAQKPAYDQNFHPCQLKTGIAVDMAGLSFEVDSGISVIKVTLPEQHPGKPDEQQDDRKRQQPDVVIRAEKFHAGQPVVRECNRIIRIDDIRHRTAYIQEQQGCKCGTEGPVGRRQQLCEYQGECVEQDAEQRGGERIEQIARGIEGFYAHHTKSRKDDCSEHDVHDDADQELCPENVTAGNPCTVDIFKQAAVFHLPAYGVGDHDPEKAVHDCHEYDHFMGEHDSDGVGALRHRTDDRNHCRIAECLLQQL